MRCSVFEKSAVAVTTFVVAFLLLAIDSPGLGQTARPEVSDQAISDQIEDELLFDRAVNSGRVDVTTDDGIVTLSGNVTNLLAKQRAQRIAEIVKGVRSVINRIDISPPLTRTDAEIRESVAAALDADAAIEGWEVYVVVVDGNATLSGTVESWQEKQLAEKVVSGVSGVRSVTNEIAIDYETERPDSEIREEVERVLDWSIYVDNALIDVAVKDGVVRLSGTVGSAAEKTQARQLAWVAGVENVEAANLSVEKWARDPSLRKRKFVDKSEEQIKQAISDALVRDPRVLAFNIQPEVVGAAVTLRGNVDNLKAKRAAAQVARSTVGVSSVINRVKVRPEEMASDESIEVSVDNALENDVYVDRFDITTVVVNGVVHLYGEVDTAFEKTRAENKASRVFGVVDVRNHLDVDPFESYSYDPYVDYDDYYFDYDYDFEPEVSDPTLTDFEVKQEIEDELFWSPFVNADEVNVSVSGRVATLTGSVDSWTERQSAVENAYEGGAISVINNIEVD